MAKKKTSRAKNSSSDVSKTKSKSSSKSSLISKTKQSSKTNTGEAASFSSTFKWIVVALLGACGVFGNIKFAYFPFSERLVVLIVLGLVMFGLALSTNLGKVCTRLFMDARYEMRKVSWPSRHEMTQLTIIVIIVVAIASLILWAVDGFFNYIITRLIT